MTPDASDPEVVERERADRVRWGPSLAEIAGRHGLEGAPEATTSGTLPVFLFPSAAVKLYAPTGGAWPDEEVERRTLERVAGVIPAPRVRASGALGDWRYLVLDRVAGQPIEACLDGPGRLDALRRFGAAVRALHAIDPAGLPSTMPDFERFLTGQQADARALRRKMPDAWREPVARFVADTPRGDETPVLLHTELAPAHALVDPATLQLTGLIDWVEAMVGDAEYDLAAVAFFVTRGDGEALGAFLDGYGWDGPRGEALARRLMRYLLLHRYAPLAWLLSRRPVRGATTVDDLLVPWMGLAPC